MRLLEHARARFFTAGDRRLRFATSVEGLEIIRVRSFDVATFVAYGAAHIGIAGSDVLMEFDHPEIYAPVDLRWEMPDGCCQ